MHVSFNVDLISVVKDIPADLDFHMQANKLADNVSRDKLSSFFQKAYAMEQSRSPVPVKLLELL